ncbi:hypothetical protein Patl1_33431 [Pistacia atlantica]|uniref:Uncharacterized protein n=1 Tax=Pistacia atlantica TaxID=434234 RepID=A0ACC0ZSJ0_9ROSI|nr:hypothetical protein Patl1_33431 [Pistacia atlantica]
MDKGKGKEEWKKEKLVRKRGQKGLRKKKEKEIPSMCSCFSFRNEKDKGKEEWKKEELVREESWKEGSKKKWKRKFVSSFHIFFYSSTVQPPKMPAGKSKVNHIHELLLLHKEFTTMGQAQTTHAAAPDDVRESLAVKPLLYIIEDIFEMQPATPSAVPGFGFDQEATQMQLNVLDDKAFQFDHMLDLLSSTINEISCKICCKFPGGGDHELATTLEIFKTLRSYEWDAKAVLALVAFALNFGEFLVMPQPFSSNPLVKSVSLLKELPEPQESVDTHKPKCEEVSNVIKAALNVTKWIVELREFESQNDINADQMKISTAVYWTIRSIVGCASQILALAGLGYEKISSIEKASFAKNVSFIHDGLKILLNQITDRQRLETLKTLMKEVPTDNTEVMRRLIYAKEDQLPLLKVKDDTKTRASIEVLKRKNVLLLISDVYTDEEVFILDKMYREFPDDRTREYEVVWIPVVDMSTPWSQAKQDQFENRQSKMPWYSVYHPLMIDKAVIMYIQEVWQFIKNPIIVVFDREGKVINTNALHIIWIWGSRAFPFTSSKEAELWTQETWRIDLLANHIDAAIQTWIEEGNYIFVYGGGNIDWIKKFTTAAQTVAEAAGIKLQILYVGKKDPTELIWENISVINVEKLSHSLQDLPLVWFFWERLKSMYHSRMQLGYTVEHDHMMKEINTILSFDESDEGWAVFCRGSAMAMAKSDTILQCLSDFELWRTHVKDEDIVTALNHYHRKLLFEKIMESPQKDNMKVLRKLIYAKEDQLLLLKGDTKEKVNIEVLKSKIVLLLISDMDITMDELRILQELIAYSGQCLNGKEIKYEVVWIPVVDRSTALAKAKQDQFENLLWKMPWYSVYDHSMVDPGVITYIKKVWQFKEKPIVVVIDPEGEMVNNNAFHMLRIWGILAFPFTRSKEAELWTRQTRGIELLAENIDKIIASWIEEEKYICLYGGDDIEWIRKFTATAKTVAQAAGIPLEILYVGKSNPEEKIQENISSILVEKLSSTLLEPYLVWFFWKRIESMWNSKIQLSRELENDPTMHEILTMLSFDSSDEGWAMFCRGRETAMAKAKGETILQCLEDFDSWKKHMEDMDFVTALNHQLNQLQKPTSMIDISYLIS